MNPHDCNSPGDPQTTAVKERPYAIPGLIEDAPVFRANIELRDGLKSVKALNRSTELKKRSRRVDAVTTMEAEGHGISKTDCQIAATALACGLTLVSNDGELRRVPGLKVVDWQAVR